MIVIGFSLFMFIGETFGGENPGEPLTANAIIGLSIADAGLIGLGLAWKWKLTGDIIALASFVVLALRDPTVLNFPLLYIWPLVGLLFIVLWALSRKTTVKKKSV